MRPFFLALAAVVFLSSCNESSDSGKPEVALVMKSLANEFFKTMADGAEMHQSENTDRYSLIVNGIRNETDINAQVNLIEQMVSRGVDAIVIAPADSKALVPALKRARDAGIVVVNIDNQLDRDVLAEAGLEIPFVGPDNREGAKLVGMEVATHLSPGDKVAVIEGVPTAFNAVQRRLGFEDAIAETGLQIVASQLGSWEMSKANTVATAMLIEHPDVKAILCANDSMALGAVQAVKAAGAEGRVLIAGFDHISAVVPLIENGSMIATVDQHGDELAVFGIEAAIQILNGEAAVEDRKTAVDLILKNPN